MLALFVLQLSLQALGCSILFPNDLKISYTITGGSVRFKYSLPVNIYHTYTWVGFGLKRFEDGHSMVRGDYVTIDIRELMIEDRAGGEWNGFPLADDLIGGKDSLTGEAFSMVEEYVLNFLWDRDLDTDDRFDIPLVPGERYYAQWAFGELSHGVFKMHADQGYTDFVFGVCESDLISIN